MTEEMEKKRGEWISHAEVLLGSGKGHMGIILYLRSQGMAPDLAKRISFDVFDEAKRRLRRSQMLYLIAGWFFIALGILGPLLLLIFTSRIVVFSAMPLLGGLALLSKVINPSRLPQESGNEVSNKISKR